MEKRIEAKKFGEVVERTRALHIDVMSERNPPTGDHGWGQPHEADIRFKEDAHIESDQLMLDALATSRGFKNRLYLINDRKQFEWIHF